MKKSNVLGYGMTMGTSGLRQSSCISASHRHAQMRWLKLQPIRTRGLFLSAKQSSLSTEYRDIVKLPVHGERVYIYEARVKWRSSTRASRSVTIQEIRTGSDFSCGHAMDGHVGDDGISWRQALHCHLCLCGWERRWMTEMPETRMPPGRAAGARREE